MLNGCRIICLLIETGKFAAILGESQDFLYKKAVLKVLSGVKIVEPPINYKVLRLWLTRYTLWRNAASTGRSAIKILLREGLENGRLL